MSECRYCSSFLGKRRKIMASGSVLTGHHETATGTSSTGKVVNGYGSNRQEAIDNCVKAGSTSIPVIKK